jgi:hypothetical protein
MERKADDRCCMTTISTSRKALRSNRLFQGIRERQGDGMSTRPLDQIDGTSNGHGHIEHTKLDGNSVHWVSTVFSTSRSFVVTHLKPSPITHHRSFVSWLLEVLGRSILIRGKKHDVRQGLRGRKSHESVPRSTSLSQESLMIRTKTLCRKEVGSEPRSYDKIVQGRAQEWSPRLRLRSLPYHCTQARASETSPRTGTCVEDRIVSCEIIPTPCATIIRIAIRSPPISNLFPPTCLYSYSNLRLYRIRRARSSPDD